MDEIPAKLFVQRIQLRGLECARLPAGAWKLKVQAGDAWVTYKGEVYVVHELTPISECIQMGVRADTLPVRRACAKILLLVKLLLHVN